MSYETFERAYLTLPEEQQQIVYNLVLSLGRLADGAQEDSSRKRSFGKFADKATAAFSEDWEMTEAELCAL